ncbi:trichohyalin-like [Pangasianodon hypophthalmus]|uniref:trichohyalin-like n=1 Tax=Pangasianodon hypophthalmus TaxID=310915 RepID=UPI0023079F55|nr:trichohyalin-like [Pangasianodon hypophthalmus]
MFRRIRERFRRRTPTKPKEDPKEEAMKEELEKVAREMEESKVMQKKLVEERHLLVKKVAELNAIVASEQKQREQDMEERDARHQQNISELQASLKLGEEREKTAEQERENLTKDREQLEKRVAQLEATLASEQKKQEEEREKVKKDMEERNARHQQNISELQASLKLSEKWEKTAEMEIESLIREQEHLVNHVAQLEAALSSERKKQEEEREKAKERNTAHLQNITELQASLKLSEEREKTAELERDSFMKDRERLEKRVAELEATLASEQKTSEQERKKAKLEIDKRNPAQLLASQKLCEEQEKTAELKRERLMRNVERLDKTFAQLEATLAFERQTREQGRQKAKQDMEERNTAYLQNITELQASLKLCEEREKAAELERENLMRHQVHLENHVAQLEGTLIFEQQKWEQEREKAKLYMEERNTAYLQNITKLQASLNLCEEREKTAELERGSWMRKREHLEKNVAELEATLAFERQKRDQEREKAKLYMEERKTAYLQNITELQASLKLCEEREKTAELERERLLRHREHLEKHVAQLEANLASERKKWKQERKKAKLDIEDRNSTHLQNITELQASLKLCEEWEKTAEQERESWRRNRERMEKHLAQLESSLASEREDHEQEKNKLKLDNEKMNTTLLEKITKLKVFLELGEEKQEKAELKSKTEQLERLRAIEKMCRARAPEPGTIEVQARCLQEEQQAVLGQTPGERNFSKLKGSLKICEEQQKIAEQGRKKRIGASELLKKAAQLNRLTLQCKRNRSMKKRRSSWTWRRGKQLQNITELQASLKKCEGRQEMAQLGAGLDSEQERQNQEQQKNKQDGLGQTPGERLQHSISIFICTSMRLVNVQSYRNGKVSLAEPGFAAEWMSSDPSHLKQGQYSRHLHNSASNLNLNLKPPCSKSLRLHVTAMTAVCVVIRDIKEDNILLNTLEVKLIDVGSSFLHKGALGKIS